MFTMLKTTMVNRNFQTIQEEIYHKLSTSDIIQTDSVLKCGKFICTNQLENVTNVATIVQHVNRITVVTCIAAFYILSIRDVESLVESYSVLIIPLM